MSYDARDNPLNPTRGWYFSLQVEESSKFFGSNFAYVRASPEARGYLSLGTRTVLATRLRLASTYLVGQVLPITQRYFAGGSSSQRGFAQQTLSPVLGGGNGVPVGGESLAETNFEIRRFVYDWGSDDDDSNDIAVVAFVDGADVTNKPAELFESQLHWATGMGLRWHTIVGTFRGDLGYRLNRTGPNEIVPGSTWEWFINLGEAF